MTTYKKLLGTCIKYKKVTYIYIYIYIYREREREREREKERERSKHKTLFCPSKMEVSRFSTLS